MPSAASHSASAWRRTSGFVLLPGNRRMSTSRPMPAWCNRGASDSRPPGPWPIVNRGTLSCLSVPGQPGGPRWRRPLHPAPEIRRLPLMSPNEPAPRASDNDRERVVERLREAAADGRLDMTEFDERMTAAYEARTVPELAPLLADLPEHTPRDAVVPGGRPPPSPSRGRVGGVLSSTNRRGLWQVPQHLDVSLFLASSTLDFSTAAFTDQT